MWQSIAMIISVNLRRTIVFKIVMFMNVNLRRDTPHHLKNKRVSQGVDKERVATIIAQVGWWSQWWRRWWSQWWSQWWLRWLSFWWWLDHADACRRCKNFNITGIAKAWALVLQALQKLQHCRRALQKFFLQALQKGGEQINGDEKVVASGPEVIILVITFMLVISLVVM